MVLQKRFKLRFRGRSGLQYSEGNQTAEIEMEMLNGDAELVIYFDSFQSWQPPYQQEHVSESDRVRIRQNIKDELERHGLRLVWE